MAPQPLTQADLSASGYVAEPHEGEEVARRLSLAILRPLGSGSAGSAHLLEDGRVLKTTSSESEAVRAALLMGAQVGGAACPGFPRIDRVVRMSSGLEIDGVLYATETYAIVREEAADLTSAWRGGNDLPYWMLALSLLGEARLAGAADVPDLGPARHCAPHVVEVFDAIAWAAGTLGFAIDDVRTSNFGLAGGRVVVRDFGGDNIVDDFPGVLESLERIPDRPAPSPRC